MLALDTASRAQQRHIHVADVVAPDRVQRNKDGFWRLRENVEAWEWWDECRRCVEWLDETYCSNDTFSEAEATYLAAREAVHADRE